jgi:hypothetical protein
LYALQQAVKGHPEALEYYDKNYAGELLLILQPGRMLDNLAAARTIITPAEPVPVVTPEEPLPAIKPGERARLGAGVKLTPEPEVASGAETIKKPYSPPTVKTSPVAPYNREMHYGKTPTTADRKALGAGPGEVVDHDPPLGERYYLGDKELGEKPGMIMTPEERAASANDRTRMRIQPADESNRQGGEERDWMRTLRKVFFGVQE